MIRILYDIAAYDPSNDDGAAQRYALEIAGSLSEAGLAEVRIVGGRRTSGPSWILALRQRQHAREVAKAIADFKPNVVHRAGHTSPATDRGTYQLFSTFNDVAAVATSTSSFEKMHGHLICPSESARSRAMEILGIQSEYVSAVPPGARPSHPEGASRAARGNFFLFVGPRADNGNFDSLLQAVATTPTLSHIRIVAFSGGSFAGAERKRMASLGLTARVSAPSGDDTTLAGHYTSALALVHPRLDDDFGLPILEAMAHGCPVACSRSGSLQEIGGNAVLDFDPTDISDLGTALVHLAADAGLRERLAIAGRARADQFSWRTCAEKTLVGYETLVSLRG